MKDTLDQQNYFNGHRACGFSGPIFIAVCARLLTSAAAAAESCLYLLLHAARVGERERVERPWEARSGAAVLEEGPQLYTAVKR